MTRRPTTITLDPGGTTGHAMFIEPMQWFSAGQDDPYTVESWLDGALKSIGETVHVAVERFTILPNSRPKTSEYDALYVIGVAEYLCRKYGATFKLQDVAAAKKMGSSDRLRRLGFWTPGQEHANDAARHMVLSLVDRGWYSPALEG